MEARGLALNTSHHVPRPQPREPDRATSEPIREKPADEGDVIEHRRADQRPIIEQVLPERLRGLLNRRQSRSRDLLRWDHAAAVHTIDELPEGCRISLVKAHPSSARSQVA